MARATRRGMFETIDEAVVEHRKSMAGRSKSAGRDRQQAPRRGSSPRRVTPAAAREAAAILKQQSIEDFSQRQGSLRPGRTIEYSSGSDTFAFPTPSPRMPPRSATFQSYKNAPPSPGRIPRSATFQDRQLLDYNDASPGIGMAIGSPSHAPPTLGRPYTPDTTAYNISRRAPAALPPSHSPPRQDIGGRGPSRAEAKRKNNGWRAFGNMFRKAPKPSEELPHRNEPEARSRYTANHSALPESHTDLLRTTRLETPMSCLPSPNTAHQRWTHSRTSSQKQEQRQHFPQAATRHGQAVQRSAPMPLELRKGPASPRIHSPLPWHVSAEDDKNPTQNQHNPPEISAADRLEIPVPAMPHLDLDLPELSFPRYSVLFEKLLSSDGKPSLQERRQSRLQGTKSYRQSTGEGLEVQISGADVKRSKTSPHLTRPLSIRVEDPTSRGRDMPQEDGTITRPPILRSKTAPSSNMSPIATAFMRKRDNVRASSSPESPSGSTFHSENSLPATPTTVTTCTDSESVRQVLGDADRGWDMLTVVSSKPSMPPKSNSYNTSDSFSTNDDIPAKRLQHLSNQYPRVTSPSDLERQMVSVSEARQVSVSRARSRVQKAMDAKAAPAVVPLRPRIIEFSKNRKSAAASLVFDDAATAAADAPPAERRINCPPGTKNEPMPAGAAQYTRQASLAFEEAMREKRKSSAASIKSNKGDQLKRRRSCSVKSDKSKSRVGSVVLAVEAEEVVNDFGIDDEDEIIPDVPAVPDEVRKGSIASPAPASRPTEKEAQDAKAPAPECQQTESKALNRPESLAAKMEEDAQEDVEPGQLVSDPATRETIHVRLEDFTSVGGVAKDVGSSTETLQGVKVQIDNAIDSVQALLGGDGQQ